MTRIDGRTLSLAGIAAAAGDDGTDRELVDGLIATWLFEKGFLEPKDGISAPDDEDVVAAIPGWCSKASAAERLQMRLLPGWRFDVRGGMTVTLVPPAGLAIVAPVSGVGPNLARGILAATFSALLAIETATPAAIDPFAEIRAAMQRELVDG